MNAAAGSRPHAPQFARGKRPQFYDQSGLDQAMSMILVLASEFCVLRDRIDGFEHIAKQRGIDVEAELGRLELDQQALEAREKRRQELLERLYYLVRKDAAELAAADSSGRYEAVIQEIAQR